MNEGQDLVTPAQLAILATQLCQIETTKRAGMPRAPRPPKPEDFFLEAYKLVQKAALHLEGE